MENINEQITVYEKEYEESTKCRRCGDNNMIVYPQIFANNTVHLRLDCNTCGKYQKYLPHTLEPDAFINALETRTWSIKGVLIEKSATERSKIK